MTAAHATPIAKPEASHKAPEPTAQTDAPSSAKKRTRDCHAPGDDTIHWLLGGADAGEPIQRKPIDAGYGDIVAAARSGPPSAQHLQRKCARCDEEEERRKQHTGHSSTAVVQHMPADPATAATAPSGGGAATPGGPDLLQLASVGVQHANAPLPHVERIQQAFGSHDVSHVRAVVGSAGATAATHMGAEAYALGDRVAFRSAPDLHLAAHEAAHVVQQRAGVHLKDGVGRAGDHYERQADEIGDAVVAGRSAEPLLDQVTGGHSARTPALQLDDKDQKKNFSNETQSEFEKRVKDAGAARLTQNIATLGKWSAYISKMEAFQLKAQLLTSTLADYYTTALGMYGGNKKFETLVGTQEGGLRSYLSQELRGDPAYRGKVQGFEELIGGRSFGYYTTPSIAQKSQVLVGDIKESDLPLPKWVPAMPEYEFYRETLRRKYTGEIHSGCQYCHEINRDWYMTATKYGAPLPDPDRWRNVSDIVPLVQFAFDLPGMKQKKKKSDVADREALLTWLQAQQPHPAAPKPAPQQQAPAPQQQGAPTANRFLPAGEVPAEVTVPPPRSSLCGKLPEKAAGTPSPNLASWGVNAGIVASVIARVNAVLTPLGPRGYRVLTGDTFDALWSMTPDSIESVRAQILAQIDARIADYTKLRGQIQSGGVPYYELCPIVDELYNTTSEAVKKQAFHDVMVMRYREAVLNVVELVLTGLSFMFPPAAIVTVPASLALGLVRAGIGADQVRQGGQWSKGVGAGVYSAEQEAEAEGLRTRGIINIVAGVFSTIGAARGLSTLGETQGSTALAKAGEAAPQPVINVIKTPNGYVITHTGFPGCAIKVEGAAVEAVNEAGEVVATGVISPNGVAWKTGPYASGDVAAGTMVPAGKGTVVPTDEGAVATPPKPGAPVLEGAEPRGLLPGPKPGPAAAKAWDDPTLTLDEFIKSYRQRIPKTGLSDESLTNYYNAGKRLNPATNKLATPRVEPPPGFARTESLPEPGTPAYDQWQKWKPGDPNAVPCFPAGTPVLTPSGPVAIEKLEPGDQVLAGDAEERAVLSTVTDVHRNWAAELVRVETPHGETWATLNHPFRVVNLREWVPAGRLERGMALRLADGSTTTVRSAERAATREATFNLSVAVHHTYYVSPAGILVHNAPPSIYADGTTYDITIYRVIDTRTQKVVYVGQTEQPLDTRLWQHANKEESILYLKDATNRANFKKIYTIEPQAHGRWTQYEANVWEQHIMDVERSHGSKLLNRQASIDWAKGKKYVGMHNPCR